MVPNLCDGGSRNKPGWSAASRMASRAAMGSSSSSRAVNAATSLGISQNLSGERLRLHTQLSEKALATFPPPFSNAPHEGPVSTPDGDRTLAKGQWAMARRAKAPKDCGSTGRFGPGFPTMQEIEAELGGVDGFFLMFGLHYCYMFSNPRMSVLFDTRNKDSAVCALDHGKRVACTLLDEVYSTHYFSQLGRGFSGAFAVMGTHNTAKKCPMRPRSQQVELPRGHRKANRRFTTKQRDTWVGQIMCGAEDMGASQVFVESWGRWLAMQVSAYAPFVNEDTGELDWMEESKYG